MAAPLALVPALISINRGDLDRDYDPRRRLRLWKLRGRRYRLSAHYPIAIGEIGRSTPAGLYWVENKSRTPAWKAPDWAEEPGRVYEYGEEGNPFFGGFIALAESDGVGIHGVNFEPRLGYRASHGCIRMSDEGILDLYDRAPIGCPVLIH